MATEEKPAAEIARGIEAAFRDQTNYAFQRRDEAFLWIQFWAEKMSDAGATVDQTLAAREEARALIESRYAERIEKVKSKRPGAYAQYGLDPAAFDEWGEPVGSNPDRLVMFDDD